MGPRVCILERTISASCECVDPLTGLCGSVVYL